MAFRSIDTVASSSPTRRRSFALSALDAASASLAASASALAPRAASSARLADPGGRSSWSVQGAAAGAQDAKEHGGNISTRFGTVQNVYKKMRLCWTPCCASGESTKPSKPHVARKRVLGHFAWILILLLDYTRF